MGILKDFLFDDIKVKENSLSEYWSCHSCAQDLLSSHLIGYTNLLLWIHMLCQQSNTQQALSNGHCELDDINCKTRKLLLPICIYKGLHASYIGLISINCIFLGGRGLLSLLNVKQMVAVETQSPAYILRLEEQMYWAIDLFFTRGWIACKVYSFIVRI